jgi:hypothetical protein
MFLRADRWMPGAHRLSAQGGDRDRLLGAAMADVPMSYSMKTLYNHIYEESYLFNLVRGADTRQLRARIATDRANSHDDGCGCRPGYYATRSTDADRQSYCYAAACDSHRNPDSADSHA